METACAVVCLSYQRLSVSAFSPAPSHWCFASSDVWSARPDCTGLFHRPAQTSPGPLGHPVLLASAASPVNVRRDAKMSTMIRPASPASVQPGRLLGVRQLAGVV